MTLTPVREVANLERYSLARSNADIYHNVVVGTRLQLQSQEGQQPTQVPSDPAQWLALLTGPLTWLVQQHPALSVIVGDHLSAKPKFLRMPSIDLSRVIRVTTIQQSSEIAQVLEHEHSMLFDFSNAQVPLWRIVVAHVKEDDSFYLFYSFQHVIGDGRSAMAFTEQLVERLNIQAAESPSMTNKPGPSTVIVPPNDPLPLSVEKRVDCSPSVPTLIKEATMALLLPAFVKKALESRYWAGEIDATLSALNESQVGMWYLTKEETAQVVKAAKSRSSTVQSILFTASNFAIKSVFLSKVEEASKLTTTKDKLSFATPVSLRTLISPPIAPQDQGSYTSEIVTKDIKVDLETGFWNLTQSYRNQIVQGTTTPGGVNHMLEHAGLLEYLPKHDGGWEAFLRGQVAKEQHGRLATLKLSNIGRAWDQPQSSSLAFKVCDAIFSQSASITGSAFTLNAATANGILSIVATWQKATFSSRERAELFLEELKRILLEATESERKDYRFREALLSRKKD
ncbi:alcohol acetyltransferase [Dissophora ornata]|nr:alcohol acetyltransferase [Dissophora ornata]